MGTLDNRCRIIIGAQKGTIVLTTTHIEEHYSRHLGSHIIIPRQALTPFAPPCLTTQECGLVNDQGHRLGFRLLKGSVSRATAVIITYISTVLSEDLGRQIMSCATSENDLRPKPDLVVDDDVDGATDLRPSEARLLSWGFCFVLLLRLKFQSAPKQSQKNAMNTRYAHL